MKKIAIVAGGSSGIGLEITKALVLKDYFVYTMSRREFLSLPQEKSKHISLDITDEENLTKAFSDIWEKEGRIDLAVCASGFGISGAVEFTNLEEAKKTNGCKLFRSLFIYKDSRLVYAPPIFWKDICDQLYSRRNCHSVSGLLFGIKGSHWQALRSF